MIHLIHIISFLYLFVPSDKQDALVNARCRLQLAKISLKLVYVFELAFNCLRKPSPEPSVQDILE